MSEAATYAPEIPAVVKAKANAADEMIRNLAAAKAAPAPASEAPAPAPASEAPTPTPAPASEAPTPTPAPAPAPTPTPTPPPTDNDALARAEQDARTWRGRFEAAERDRRALEASLAELRASVDALKAAQAAPAPKEDALVQPAVQALTPKELDDFGPDLMDAVARHATHAVAPLIEAAVKRAMDKIQGEIGSLKATTDSVKQTAQMTADERFVANLTAGLKDWQKVDTNPAFLEWLREYDPLIGRTRKESLDDATASRDSERVLAFFRAFLNQQGGSAPRIDQPPPESGAAGAPGTQPAASAATAPPVSLEDLAAPGLARTAEPVAPTGKRVWKLSEIRLHAAKVARREYADPAEKDRIDREIALAQREGRVVDG